MKFKLFLPVALSATLLFLNACSNDEIKDEQPKEAVLIPLVTVENVTEKDFKHEITIQGSVDSDKDALINAEASGVIKTIHVKEGQKVSKGQSLITIDSQVLQSTIEEVENSLELATYMFNKQQKLMDEGVGVEFDFETAKNNKIALEKKIKTMRSQRGKTVVKAPFSGYIENIVVSEGEMAAPQIPLLRVVDNKNINIEASISEN